MDNTQAALNELMNINNLLVNRCVNLAVELKTLQDIFAAQKAAQKEPEPKKVKEK